MTKQTKPIIHSRDHTPGGADPMGPWDATLTAGDNYGVRSAGPQSEGLVLTSTGDGGSRWAPAGVDTATGSFPDLIRSLGDLTLYYRMGELPGGAELSPDLVDTSEFDVTPRNMIQDYRAGAGETTRPLFGEPNNSFTVVDDDGCVRFRFDQTIFHAGSPDQPGWLFEADSTATVASEPGDLAAFQTGDFPSYLRTVLCFFQPYISTNIGQPFPQIVPIVAAIKTDVGGSHVQSGWAIAYDPFDEKLVFMAGEADRAMEISAPGPIDHIGFWMAAVTWDETEYTMRLYEPAGLVDMQTYTEGPLDSGEGMMRIDYSALKAGVGVNDRFFFGRIDEVATFSRELTESELATIATAAFVADAAPAGYVYTSPGDGSPGTWEKPTFEVEY